MAEKQLPYGEVLKTRQEVEEGIAQQAERVIEFYGLNSKVGQKVLFVTLLNGGVPHAEMLMQEIAHRSPHAHPDLQYIKISRYGSSQEASNSKVDDERIPLGLKYQKLVPTFDAVALLDDVADDGHSLDIAYDEMMGYGARAVDAWVLGNKAKETPAGALGGFRNIDVIFPNFPNVWLTGMGLDDTGIALEANRHLKLIAVARSQQQGLSQEEIDSLIADYHRLPAEHKRYYKR